MPDNKNEIISQNIIPENKIQDIQLNLVNNNINNNEIIQNNNNEIIPNNNNEILSEKINNNENEQMQKSDKNISQNNLLPNKEVINNDNNNISINNKVEENKIDLTSDKKEDKNKEENIVISTNINENDINIKNVEDENKNININKEKVSMPNKIENENIKPAENKIKEESKISNNKNKYQKQTSNNFMLAVKSKINQIKEQNIKKDQIKQNELIINPPTNKKKEKQEKIIFPSALSLEEISEILSQMMKCICRIELNENKFCTGSFVKISNNKRNMNCLLTSNEIINNDYIKNNKQIKLFLNEGKVIKTISINNNKNIYINDKYGVTLIEIKDDNEINDFLELDKFLLEDFDDFKGLKELEESNDKEEEDYPKDFFRNKSIYIPHYQNNKKVFVSFGTVNDFNDFEIIHFCNINDNETGSSGAPIIDLENKTVIGIYKHEKKLEDKRCGIFLELAAKDFAEKNLKNLDNIINISLRCSISKINKINMIKIKLIVDEESIGKRLYFLDNCNNNIKDCQSHLKELNENNVEIEINGNKSNYTKSFIPTKTKNEIVLKFKKPMIDCSYMFYKCSSISEIDLSLFDTESVTNMECMFAFCSNLKYIDLSYLDTKNVKNMDKMFFLCLNLEKIKLSYLGNPETHMENIFFSCDKFSILDLSFLEADDEFDIKWIKKLNPNLKTIIVKKEIKDKFRNCKLKVEYI